ncbi:putative uncharacterized domain protein [Xanthomonas citri pv. mangiferaeindicae LMG 941]|nr:putative uncharacterized domain protein [Xanthomonas citri pv. mangiferaeindicae LMG 941]
MQSRESAGGPDCQDATQDDRKKITAASLRKRAQCTRVSYIRDVQPHQSMPCVTNRYVRHVRARSGWRAPSICQSLRWRHFCRGHA